MIPPVKKGIKYSLAKPMFINQIKTDCMDSLIHQQKSTKHEEAKTYRRNKRRAELINAGSAQIIQKDSNKSSDEESESISDKSVPHDIFTDSGSSG